jgi:hypothetical protein
VPTDQRVVIEDVAPSNIDIHGPRRPPDSGNRRIDISVALSDKCAQS